MVERFRDIWKTGWIQSLRPLNSGGIGNTIDDLLGFPENNLPIADTAQWELKSHRLGSSSLLTLFHMEPEPRSAKVVPSHLLPKYGWPDQSGREDELSFRQTLRVTESTDRDFRISIDRTTETIHVHFDSDSTKTNQQEWLQTVIARTGLGPLNPQPYWNFQDLFLKASTKLLNSFYVEAETQRSNGEEYFRIHSVLILQGFELDRFLGAMESGAAMVDFDARTHHNHGTKFRIKQDWIPKMYRYTEQAI